ncbi:MAG TPA: nucleoside-triphosphatase [Methylomirabilota bacterium]|nr:nucleoside-triphosphatase [Methylomirabilota bacterium]
MRLAAALVLAAAVAAAFTPRIEVAAAAAAAALVAAWRLDRGAVRAVARFSLVLGVAFAAAVAAAAVAWSSGLAPGLRVGGTVLLRLVVLAVAASVVARKVDVERLLRAAERLGLERLGLLLGLSLNALPHLTHTATTVWTAHRLRSGGRWRSMRRLPELAEVLLAHTARVADRAAAAAALRGHTALIRVTAPITTTARIVVVTGRPGGGKTPVVAAAAEELGRRGIRVVGFLQPAVVEDGRKVGFELRDAATGETAELARRVEAGEGMHGTSFVFAQAGFELGRRALAAAAPGVVLVVDEIGPVELRGGGHWPAVRRALAVSGVRGAVVVVRRALVPSLLVALDATDAVVVDLEDPDVDDPVAAIVNTLIFNS